MLIYVSFVLNLYLGILHHMYTKRAKYHKEGQAEESPIKKDIDVTTNNFTFAAK